MNELLVFLQSLPDAFKTGFIYAIMVMGVYITYKILDFPDMSVDATFPLGGFIFAAFALSKNGFMGITHPVMGLILSVIGGMIAGYLTGALHVYLGINGLLSGILIMTGFYSINIARKKYLWSNFFWKKFHTFCNSIYNITYFKRSLWLQN